MYLYNSEDITDEIEFECEYDSWGDKCKRLFDKFEAIAMIGRIGRWDGPVPDAHLFRDEQELHRNILLGLTRSSSEVSIEYATEDEIKSPLQRYSSMWSIDVSAGTIVKEIRHHDGVNVQLFRGVDKEGLKEIEKNEIPYNVFFKEKTLPITEEVLFGTSEM